MNFKKTAILPIIFSLVILSGCGDSEPEKNYELINYGLNPDFNVVTMKTYDPVSEYFTFRYDTTKWTLEEWDAEAAPNIVALVRNDVEDRGCYILPGTIGQGNEEGYSVYEGSLLTQRYVARTLDVINPAGITLVHVVGYEVNEVPYIFEVGLVTKDTDQCSQDAQAVISTFDVNVTVEEVDDDETSEDSEEEVVEEESSEESTEEEEETTEESEE